MDIPRYALIATSVLLGLMLLGEWTQFSANQQDAASPPTPMVEQSYAQDIPAAEAMPSVPSSNSDLPIGEDVDLPSAGQREGPSTDVTSASGQFITVQTVTLEIIIDLIGGDVVGAGGSHGVRCWGADIPSADLLPLPATTAVLPSSGVPKYSKGSMVREHAHVYSAQHNATTHTFQSHCRVASTHRPPQNKTTLAMRDR